MSLEGIRAIPDEEKSGGPAIPIKSNKPGTVELWSHVNIADGIELHLEPKRAGLSPEKLRKLLHSIKETFEIIQGEKL